MLLLNHLGYPFFEQLDCMSNHNQRKELIAEELAKVSPDRDMALTIGVFDGVHRGHQRLISELEKLARQQNLLSGVVTFLLGSTVKSLSLSTMEQPGIVMVPLG